MKKYDFRKILIFVLAVIMIFSLASCNKRENGDDDDNGKVTTPGYLGEALEALIEGLDALIDEGQSLDGQMYAEATIFVKSAENVDLEIEIAANIKQTNPELKLAIKTEGAQLIAFYLKGDTVYVKDNLSKSKITVDVEGETVAITPAKASDARSLKFDLAGGIAGVELGTEVAKLPGLLKGLFTDLLIVTDPDTGVETILDSIGEVGLIGDIDLDSIAAIAGGFDALLPTIKTSTGYQIELDITQIADLLKELGPLLGGGDPMEAIEEFLGEDSGLGDIINQAAKLLFGGTLGQLLGKEGEDPITSYPTILIGIDLADEAFSGVSLNYDYEENDMNLSAGIKNLKLQKNAKTTIMPSDIAEFDPGAVRVDLGIKGLGVNENFEIFANPVAGSNGGVGLEAFAKLTGGSGVAYARIDDDGEIDAYLDFAQILAAVGKEITGNTKFFVTSRVAEADPENEEGNGDENGDNDGGDDLDIMALIGPIFNLLLGDNNLLDAIADQELDTAELFGLLGEVKPILGAFGTEVELDEEGLTALIKQGLDFLVEFSGESRVLVSDADYIEFINDIFDIEIEGDDLQAALFSANGVNITFDFPDVGFGVIVKINLADVEVLALTLQFSFDMPQSTASFIEGFDGEDVTEVEQITDLSEIGEALMEWLLNPKN